MYPVAKDNILSNLKKEQQSSRRGNFFKLKDVGKKNCFLFFSGNIRKRNVERNEVVSKILIRENCKHPFCLNSCCFKIYSTEYVMNNKSLSYRAQKFL